MISNKQVATSKVEAAGIEPTPDSPGNTPISPQSGAESGALSAQSGLIDDALQAVIDAWPKLPEAAKLAILELVREEL